MALYVAGRYLFVSINSAPDGKMSPPGWLLILVVILGLITLAAVVLHGEQLQRRSGGGGNMHPLRRLCGACVPRQRALLWHLYRLTLHSAVGVAAAEPHGATRWDFAH